MTTTTHPQRGGRPLRPMRLLLVQLSLLYCTINFSSSFVHPTLRHRKGVSLRASPPDDDLGGMRKLLESSWNSNSMGRLPTDPNDAAKEAAGCVSSAWNRGVNIAFVDILLPSYDITQGTNLYDEVKAVDFCVALSKSLGGNSCIVVRDNKVVNAVSRVLDAREKEQAPENEVDEDEAELSEPQNLAAETKDGDAAKDSPSDEPASEVDSFRQQLMSSWDDEDTPSEEETTPPQGNRALTDDPNKLPSSSKNLGRSYRLASMFGDRVISSGPDMITTVVQAVSENGQPTEDEDTVIILSAVTPEELIGVRGIAAKYDGKKKIVIVNSSFDPLPRELIKAETVYSILPLLARPKAPGTSQDSQPPKIVVIRRYPRDWEVYIDIGEGFELAGRTPASQVKKKGPSSQWLSGCIERHLNRF